MRKFLENKKNIVIILLTGLVVIKTYSSGINFLIWVLSGVVLAVLFDLALGYVFSKKIYFSKSALITGAIVSGIIDYSQPWYVLLIFSILAIASKHVIRFKKKHIFNPANFSLFFAALFKVPLTWGIESNIYLIIIFGLYLAYSLKKIFHILGFVVFFAPLTFIVEINPFTILSFFFLFIMLIEPKTSGYGRIRGFVFGSIAGISSFLFFKFYPVLDGFIASLFVANLCNPMLEKIRR